MNLATNLSIYYVDAVEVTVVINTPWIFRTVYAVVSSMLTQRQKAKLRMFGSVKDKGVLADLHATISPELLPASLGGTATPDLWGQQAHKRKSFVKRQQEDAEDSKARGCMSWLPLCCVYDRRNDADDPVSCPEHVEPIPTPVSYLEPLDVPMPREKEKVSAALPFYWILCLC